MAACQVEVFDLCTQFWDRFYEWLLFSAGTGEKWHFWNTVCKDNRKNVKQSGYIQSIEVLPRVPELAFRKTEPIKYLNIRHKNLFKLDGYYKHLI